MGDRSREPIPLVICIEEAHKFLSPALVSQTIFGTIARELRKYNVTLLVVDQRPSGIDDEVMSQIGTRVTCLLNDEKDIDSVLTGVPGARELRGVLASLDSKQQALILGHAVPMPVVIRTRTYDDEAFRRAMGGFNRAARALTHGEPSPPPLSRGGRGGPAAVSVSAPREADSANAPGTPLPPRERGGGEGSPKAGAAPDPAPASRALELDFD